MSNHFYISFLRLPLLIRVLLIALLVFLTFGVIIHLLEPITFPTIFDGIWWAIVTASTVGYGDYVPRTLLGRFTTVILILLGVGLVSSYFITLATTAVTRQDALSEGKIAFKGNKHIIIVGWNERSRELIRKLTLLKFPQTIVLIDETLESNPVQSRYVHFIQGRSHMDETILKSNIDQAEKVLITADRGDDELQADMNSILTLLTIKGLCPHVKCIVEILTAEQVGNAVRAGADEVIQSNKLTSIFMVNSLHSKGDGLLSDFVHHLQESRLEVSSVAEKFAGKAFKDIYIELYEHGNLLIGIKRGEKTFLNPSHSLQLEKDDQLLIIS
ncbi:potassium channel family protein [Neobacillus sp. PS3-40]|uniref:potassium channel family protein n=1 Tax=Neobacillus sp. PS3-40 TaxID=3070679 RepID=UPI0027E13C79|nr:potassium channel family protein [Neobacillus sp. PS3-40]WML45861.1 potassium channel family protein [Neobacillus sp. PS3-40]